MEGSCAENANGGDKKRAKLNTDNGGDETRSLPDSIVMQEILPRLPVKSLIRFQSVSKYWLSNISKNPNFVKLHLKYSSMLRRQFFIMSYGSGFCENTGTFFLLPHQDCSNQNDLEHGWGRVGSESDFDLVVDCCNGLVCVYSQDNDDYKEDWERERKCFFGVWNPATRKCVEIDSPPGVHLALAYGFGYVASLDDYKIGASFAIERKGIEVFRGFYVYSLKSGEWEKILGNFEYFSKVRKWRKLRGGSDEVKEKLVLGLEREGLWHDGIIYWTRGWSKKHIIGFDLRKDEFIEYTSMYWESKGDMDLFRLEGSLALCNCKKSTVSEFWILKDGDDWGSWQKLFSVNLANVEFITLSENSKCLVGQLDQLKLVEFCKEALESCRVKGQSNCMLKAIDHVGSLVSPFRMTKSDEEEPNSEAAKHPVIDTVPIESKRPSPSVPSRVKVTGSSDESSDRESDDDDDDDNDSECFGGYESPFEDDAEAYGDWETDSDEGKNEEEDEDDDDDDDDDEDEDEEEEDEEDD